MAENRKRMKVIPYASAIGSIKYDMLCTRPIVYLIMSLARGYDSDPGGDHWIAVKIILRGLKNYFSVMEVIKEFIVKGYVDASLTPIRIALSRDTGLLGNSYLE